MSQVNYSRMSDRELKAYFLAHRNDKAAFEAYMDRLQQKPSEVIVAAGEIDNLSITEQVEIIAERLENRIKNKN